MKKILFALMGIVALTLASCSSDSNNDGGIQNFWTLTKENKTLYDDDTEGVKVTVTLAYTATENITLTPAINAESEEIAEAFEFSQPTITIAKGQKTTDFYVRSTGKKLITEAGTFSITLSSNAELRAGEPLSIAVEPTAVIGDLTERQQELVQSWMTNYGFDVRPFLGSLKADATVTFNEEDMNYYNNSEETATYSSNIPVTINEEKSDEENIVLHMEGNALGLKAFLHHMLLAQTTEDEDYWMINSHNTALLNAINYNADTETFNVSLDIQLNPEDKTISFTGTVTNLTYESEQEGIPFKFDFSAWNRQQNVSSLIIDNGDEADEEVDMETAISWGITLNPEYYLINSDISYDAWEAGETSLYTEPTATYDDEKMTFTFPWDFMNASGYERITVTISLNK